jgi:dTDP-4-amino-4,6-dideoxy-D-galactose acyltransferase
VAQTIIDHEIVEFQECDYYSLEVNQKQSFLDLVYLSGHLSRFKIDINFPLGSFEKLYLKWIENSVYSEIYKVLVYRINEEIIAFITLELPEESIFAKIGLIAVKPNYQGLGLGKKLIKFAERIAYKSEKQILQVVTQGTNLQAIKAYENYGFSLRNTTNIYHYWNIK